MSTAIPVQPPYMAVQPGFQPLPSRFQTPHYPSQHYAPPPPTYHPQHQSYGTLPPIGGQDRRISIPSLPMNLPPNGMPTNVGPISKRLAPSANHPAESPAKKKQSKWSADEDAAIIDLRGNGMKWEDISKHLPGRSAISCRLRFQNYLERRSEWDDEKKNKLARLYERFKKDMWEKIAKEMQLPWRAAEAMHWQIGEIEMASRANVPVFHLANSSSQSSSQPQAQPQQYSNFSTPTPAPLTDSASNGTPTAATAPYMAQGAFPQTHNHVLPHMSQPVSPGSNGTRRNSSSSVAGAESRNRADSARDTINPSTRNGLNPNRKQTQNRYLSPFGEKSVDNESN